VPSPAGLRSTTWHIAAASSSPATTRAPTLIRAGSWTASWAAIAAAAPDLVLVAPCGSGLAAAIGQAQAVARALPGLPVWAIDASGLFVRPGPRLVDGVEADRRLAQLGIEPVYGSKNPFAFMDLQDVQELSNFFERRVSAYQSASPGPCPSTTTSNRPSLPGLARDHATPDVAAPAPVRWHLRTAAGGSGF
jgi:hypothetical protein